VRLFVVHADAIYARGLQASLAELPEVEDIGYAAGITEAWAETELQRADVVLLDCELAGAWAFARQLSTVCSARILLCTARSWTDELAGAVSAAAGALSASSLTPEAVTAAVRAINTGVGVLGIDLLRTLARDGTALADHADTHTSRLEHLTQREHAVLSLVAEGVPSREIASRLAYSERTVKNVVHDVLTKLDARSRSHAVALAVREGII
jgi:DNA-binding NarL/FixJ family response regulator